MKLHSRRRRIDSIFKVQRQLPRAVDPKTFSMKNKFTRSQTQRSPLLSQQQAQTSAESSNQAPNRAKSTKIVQGSNLISKTIKNSGSN